MGIAEVLAAKIANRVGKDVETYILNKYLLVGSRLCRWIFC